MTNLSELDRSMEIVATLADHLEAQAGNAPVERIPLVTWVLSQFQDMPALEKAEKGLPQLPSKLRMDYMAWIHSLKKHA